MKDGENNMDKIKPCKTCGVKPVLERWSSGGPKFAVRCNNPDRPDSCDMAFYYSLSDNPDKTIEKWNEFQEGIPLLLSNHELRENNSVWLELFDYSEGKYCVIPCTVKWLDSEGLCLVDDTGFGHYCKNEDFNIGHSRAVFGWRCWNKQPTEERRAAILWKD